MLLLLHSVLLLLLVLVVTGGGCRSVSDDRSRLRRDRAHRPAVTSSAAVAAVTSVSVSMSVSVVANRFRLFRRFIPHNSTQNQNSTDKQNKSRRDPFIINNVYSGWVGDDYYLLDCTSRESLSKFLQKLYSSAVTVRWPTHTKKGKKKFLTGPPRPQKKDIYYIYTVQEKSRKRENREKKK